MAEKISDNLSAVEIIRDCYDAENDALIYTDTGETDSGERDKSLSLVEILRKVYDVDTNSLRVIIE